MNCIPGEAWISQWAHTVQEHNFVYKLLTVLGVLKNVYLIFASTASTNRDVCTVGTAALLRLALGASFVVG